MIGIILLVFAFVCLVLAAVNVGHPRVNLTAAGLAFYIASLLFSRAIG